MKNKYTYYTIFIAAIVGLGLLFITNIMRPVPVIA